MKRPPWYAIVFGLCAWSGLVALAVRNDIWWPLWVAGGIGVVGGLAALAMVIFARGLGKHASGPTVEPAPAAGRDEPIAEPPKRTGREGPRTNARTAGRKHKGAASAIVLGLFVVTSDGCQRGDKDEPKASDTKDAKDAKVDAKAEVAAPAKAAAEDAALAEVLQLAIVQPQTGEAEYEVDPFVAALVYESVRLGQPPTLTQLTEKKEGGPESGYVLGEVTEGSLWHRLGLRTGDVIEAMNGVVLVGPERLGFALDGAGNRVDLTIHRDGLSVVQRYRFTEGLAWREVLAGTTGAADPRVAAVGENAEVEDVRGDAALPTAPTTAVPSSDDGAELPTPTPTPTPSSGGGKSPTPKPTPTPSPKPTPTPTPKPTPTPTPSAGTSQVQCESSTKCTITKSYFDSLVNNPSKLESQANIVPAIQNDVHSGYKLKSIKSGSAIQKLGFQSNDKITHINGYDLTDDFQAAQLYMGVSNTSVFKIRYERNGARLVKTVVVK